MRSGLSGRYEQRAFPDLVDAPEPPLLSADVVSTDVVSTGHLPPHHLWVRMGLLRLADPTRDNQEYEYVLVRCMRCSSYWRYRIPSPGPLQG